MITIEEIRKKFPEAMEVQSSGGLAYKVRCWKPHRLDRRDMEISAEGEKEGVFHCHNCGHSGNLRTEFPEFFDPISYLMPELFVQRETPTAPTHKARIRRGGIQWGDMPAPGEVVPFSGLPEGHVAVEYLRGRGFDIEELRNLDSTRAIYYCQKGQFTLGEGKGTTSGRLVFPIYMLGDLKGWQTRQIDYVIKEDESDGEKVVWNGSNWQKFKKTAGLWEDRFVGKYYGCPDMKRGSLLYGFDMARNYGEIAVVEGPLDYYRTGPQSVATMGKNVSSEQIRLLKTYWSRLFVLRDPDVDPGSPLFKKLLLELAPLPVYHFCLAGNKDPGSTPRVSTWEQIADHVHKVAHGHPASKN